MYMYELLWLACIQCYFLLAAGAIHVSGRVVSSAKGLGCGRVVDPARTVEPAKHVTVPEVDLWECVNPAGLVEPATLVEAAKVAGV